MGKSPLDLEWTELPPGKYTSGLEEYPAMAASMHDMTSPPEPSADKRKADAEKLVALWLKAYQDLDACRAELEIARTMFAITNIKEDIVKGFRDELVACRAERDALREAAKKVVDEVDDIGIGRGIGTQHPSPESLAALRALIEEGT